MEPGIITDTHVDAPPMDALRFAWACEADTPALCAVFNAARAENASFPEQAHTLSAFAEATEGEHILTARIGSTIAGFAAVWAAERFLHHLYVAPYFQRRGIGNALLATCVGYFGYPMSLKCLVANTGARRFYERCGWHPRETAQGPHGPYVRYVCDAL